MSSHAAALHGTCPVVLYVQLSAAGIVSGLVPRSVYAPESVRLLLAFSFVCLGFCLLADSMRQRQILAGAVREIGSDLRISPYLSNTSQPTLEPRRRGSGIRCGGVD